MKNKLIFLFDGECPLCLRETSFLKSRNIENKIRFIDIQKHLFKFIKNKEFKKFKKKYPMNIEEILKLNDYVRLKLIKKVYNT